MNIIKDVNAKHRIVRKNIVSVLKEVYPALINVNVKIAKMVNVIIMQLSNLKISKSYTIVL